MIIKAALLFSIVTEAFLFAETGPTYKGVRAMGMGNAVTAVVDDRYALYNNPAGLNMFDGHFEFSASVPVFMNTTILDLLSFVTSHAKNLGDPNKLDRNTIEASYKIDGIWTTVGLAPEISFMSPFMGAGAYLTFPPHIAYESGPLIPKLGMGGTSDFVMMAGTARRFYRTLSLGASVKYVYRYYMADQLLTYTETKGMAKKMQSSPLTAYRELTEPTQGAGLDVGALYHFGLFRFGLSIQDFPTVIGGNLMTPQFNIGGAYKLAQLMELSFIDDMTAAIDFRDLIAYGNFLKKVHMGLETRFKNADVRVGINQGYPTFGLGFSYFFMTLNYVYYTEELGIYPGQNPLSTHLFELHLGFKFLGMYKLSLPLYLASASPRRKTLLRQFGFSFREAATHISEESPLNKPSMRARELACRKALAAGNAIHTGIILGFDTIVFHDGDILEKPRDAAEAGAMLRRLSGKTHVVYTGMAVLVRPGNKLRLHCEKTEVTFRKLEAKEIKNYISTGEPFDKAGAYGIQGMAGSFVEKVNGCFFNVVGLPVKPLMDTLKPFIRR